MKRLLLLLFFVGLFTACSGSDEPATGADPVDNTDDANGGGANSDDGTDPIETVNFEITVPGEYFRLNSQSAVFTVNDFIYLFVNKPVSSTSFTLGLLKYDLNGNLIWERTVLAPPAAGFLFQFEPILTSDNNFVLNRGDRAVKINLEGEVLWDRNDDIFLDMVEMENTDLMYLSQDVGGEFLIKIMSSEGIPITAGPFIDSEIDFGGASELYKGVLPNEYLLLASSSVSSFPEPNGAILTFNSDAELIKEFEIPVWKNGESWVFSNADNTITAFINTLDDESNSELIRIDFTAEGTLLNEFLYSDNDYYVAEEVIKLEDESFLVGGRTGNNVVNAQSVLTKLATNGVVDWQDSFGLFSDRMDFVSSMYEEPDGNLLISGSAYINEPTGPQYVSIYLKRYSADGEL